MINTTVKSLQGKDTVIPHRSCGMTAGEILNSALRLCRSQNDEIKILVSLRDAKRQRSDVTGFARY